MLNAKCSGVGVQGGVVSSRAHCCHEAPARGSAVHRAPYRPAPAPRSPRAARPRPAPPHPRSQRRHQGNSTLQVYLLPTGYAWLLAIYKSIHCKQSLSLCTLFSKLFPEINLVYLKYKYIGSDS
ncbi:unnamed protein product [Spodoptera littoralis]|uniref:Uncharacterized protein n=1 Tax=Spodoptera littoralis TaxID=7109 RepID=A0A9P0I4T8_SPOLI|nr:unnamed protein product [Spodoptera littoralis]CAH1638943.1 unnamed protein product [Spodoptera littoralis]